MEQVSRKLSWAKTPPYKIASLLARKLALVVNLRLSDLHVIETKYSSISCCALYFLSQTHFQTLPFAIYNCSNSTLKCINYISEPTDIGYFILILKAKLKHCCELRSSYNPLFNYQLLVILISRNIHQQSALAISEQLCPEFSQKSTKHVY